MTPVGAVGAAAPPALVDSDGTVVRGDARLRVEFWVRDADGWSRPGDGPVDQHLVEATPVVRTDGRGLVISAYGVAGDPPLTVVSAEPSSGEPIGVAAVVGPARRMEWADGVLKADGVTALTPLGVTPFQVTLCEGDPAHRLGTPERGADKAVRSRGGTAHAALVFTAEQGRPLRVGIPWGDTPVEPARVPRPDGVVRGWQAQTRTDTVFTVPVEGAVPFLAAVPGRLLVEGDVLSLSALIRLGYVEQVRATLAARAAAGMADPSSGDAALAAEVWAFTRDRELAEAFPPGARPIVAPVDVVHALVNASPTWTWEDRGMPARVAVALRDGCVRETGDGLALCASWADWGSGDIEVHAAPTEYGTVDVRVTVSEGRPVLQWRGLWGARKPVLTAPAIDPSWSTRDEAGTVAF